MKAIWKFLINLFSTPAATPAPVKNPPSTQPPKDTPTPSQPNKNPKWYSWVLMSLGKNEHDKAFDKYMSQFWSIVGLKGYKTIAGSKYAWCGLTIAAALYSTGYQYAKNGAGAKNWGQFGTKIDHVKKGIPHGSIVHINHGFNCSSSKGNHVALACGDYKPSDFFVNGKLKSGATITLLGGNQGDTVKFSKYDMREICEVVWPSDASLPGEVTKTVACDTSAKQGDKTQ